MAGSNNSINVGYGTSGQLVKSNGAGVAPGFTTATYPSTATGTGTILRADGTNWVASTATYPNTAGTSGNVLTSDGTNWTSAAAAGGLSSLRNTPEWFDDFVWNLGTSGDVGELGWFTGGVSGTVGVANFAGRPGVASLATGTGATNSVYIIPNTGLTSIQFASGIFTFQTSVQLSALSDGTTTYKVWIGVYDVTAMNTSGEGVYFTYTHSESSGNWVGNTSDSPGSSTILDTTTAVAASTWYDLKFVVNAASSSVEFFIDGVSKGTISTTMPVSTDPSCFFYGIQKSAGGSSRTLWIDVFYAKYALTTARLS